jgi:hypothetical protein
MTRKPDTIGYKEFNKLTDHSDTQHDPLPSEVLFDDENINQLEETLMGMEYELEDIDELQDETEREDSLELSEEDLMDDLEEDPDDINADRNVELDESAHYQGRHV